MNVNDKVVLLNDNSNHVTGTARGIKDAFKNQDVGKIVRLVDESTAFVSFNNTVYMLALANLRIAGDEAKPAAPIKKEKPKANDKIGKFVKDWADIEKNNRDIAHFAVLYEDGGVEWSPNRVCAASLGEGRGTKPIIACLFDVQKNYKQVDEDRREKYKRYITYILNQSPWAKAFLTKNVDVALADGVLMNVEYSLNTIKGASIALREGSEYQRGLDLFCELLDEEVNPHAAYIACVSIQGKGFIGMGRNHHAITDKADAEELFKFFNEGVKHSADFPFRLVNQFTRVWAEQYKIDGPADQTYAAWLRKHCTVQQEGEGWAAEKVITKGGKAKFIRSLEKALEQ